MCVCMCVCVYVCVHIYVGTFINFDTFCLYIPQCI